MPHLWCLYRYTSQSLPMYSCWTAHPTSDGCFQQPCDKAQSHLKTIVRRAVTYRSGVPNILTPAQIWTPRGFFFPPRPQSIFSFAMFYSCRLPWLTFEQARGATMWGSDIQVHTPTSWWWYCTTNTNTKETHAGPSVRVAKFLAWELRNVDSIIMTWCCTDE